MPASDGQAFQMSHFVEHLDEDSKGPELREKEKKLRKMIEAEEAFPGAVHTERMTHDKQPTSQLGFAAQAKCLSDAIKAARDLFVRRVRHRNDDETDDQPSKKRRIDSVAEPQKREKSPLLLKLKRRKPAGQQQRRAGSSQEWDEQQVRAWAQQEAHTKLDHLNKPLPAIPEVDPGDEKDQKMTESSVNGPAVQVDHKMTGSPAAVVQPKQKAARSKTGFTGRIFISAILPDKPGYSRWVRWLGSRQEEVLVKDETNKEDFDMDMLDRAPTGALEACSRCGLANGTHLVHDLCRDCFLRR